MALDIADTAPSQANAIAVHRCRFVDYTPSAISAIAFPPLTLPKPSTKDRNTKNVPKTSVSGTKQRKSRRKFGTLAVGRANGNIELYEWAGADQENQTPQAWTLWKILYGPQPLKVDSLAFTVRYPDLLASDEVPAISDLRLFSTGGGSELVEWDIVRGTILRTINSQGGAIWSIAVNPSSTTLALGCEDGSVRLLSLEHDTITHFRHFDRARCRILSIAWGPPVVKRGISAARQDRNEGDVEGDGDDDDDEWTDSWLVTGGSDSSLRKWDVATGRVLDRMTTDKVRKQQTLVWAVAVLSDGTIVSGDSLGTVRFWDARTCTQQYNFDAHGADVLCLAVSPDGDSIFSSGVDQKTCLFSYVHVSNASSQPSTPLLRGSAAASRWVHATSKRMHSHDVRALAIWPPHVPLARTQRLNPHIAPVLASGGLDMSVVIAPCASRAAVSHRINPIATGPVATFEDAYHRRVAYPTGVAPLLQLARRAGVLVCAREMGVSVWRVERVRARGLEDEGGFASQGKSGGWEKLLDMQLDVTTNVCAVAISDDGRWLAASDLYETKLFLLREVDGALRPKRIRSFADTLLPLLPPSPRLPGCGATALAFSPDSSKLVLASAASSALLVVDITALPDGQPRVLRRFDHHHAPEAVFGGRAAKRMPRRAPNIVHNGDDADEDEDNSASEADAWDAQDDKNSESEDEETRDEDSDDTKPTPLITHLAISADGQWLASTDTHCRTHIYNLDAVAHHAAVPSMSRPVRAMGFSAPPSSHAAASSTLNGFTPSAVPSPSPAPSSTGPSARGTALVLTLADHTLSIYDVEARRFPAWARATCERTPQRFGALHDPVLGIAFDPPPEPTSVPDADKMAADEVAPVPAVLAAPVVDAGASASASLGERHAIFWGSTWLCRVTLDAPPPAAHSSGAAVAASPRKRRHSEREPLAHGKDKDKDKDQDKQDESDPVAAETGDTNFQLNMKYRPMLYVDFLAAGELVVVERPLVDVLSTLPPAYFKSKYGS